MELVTIAPFYVVGIAVKTSNANYDKLHNDMQMLWNKFFTEKIIDKIPNKLSHDIYSVYTDYEGDYSKPYLALLGCKVANLDNLPDNLVAKLVNGSTYSRTTIKGNLHQGVMFEAWQKIWNMDIPRNYMADFEVYSEKAQNPEQAEVDIFLGASQLK